MSMELFVTVCMIETGTKCHFGASQQPSSGRENMGLDEEKNTRF